jgi:hypothetical protein
MKVGMPAALAAVLLSGITVISSTHAQVSSAQTIKLTDTLTLQIPRKWVLLPARTLGITEVVLPPSGASEASPGIHVLITRSAHSTHSLALDRLSVIRDEREGAVSYFSVCGWPAIERVSSIELAQVMDAQERVRKTGTVGPVMATLFTIAVTANDQVVRYEAALPQAYPSSDRDELMTLVNSLQCSAQPLSGATSRELQNLRLVPRKPAPPVGAAIEPRSVQRIPNPGQTPAHMALKKVPPFPAPGKGTLLQFQPQFVVGTPATPAASGPALLQPKSCGELQIAVSPESQHVLIGDNCFNMFSQDGGTSYSSSNPINWGFSVDGDPSVGVGASGAFYFSTIALANPPSAPAPCADVVAVSGEAGSWGQNFTPVGSAVSCPATGIGMCFPDQEQMAVDRFNSVPGLSGTTDQLYIVWRNFTPVLFATRCSQITRAIETPTISCSADSGVTWEHQTAVPLATSLDESSADVGRPAVGLDGFVYVTYVQNSNLMINKFDQCRNNLQQQSSFPVQITALNGVTCPVPGLDRCQPGQDASPQAVVDDTDASHVMVSYADSSGGNDNVFVFDSHDGGLTWNRHIVMNSVSTGRRFLPWICATQGIAYVSWYDRRDATASAPDLTAYYLNSVNLQGQAIGIGFEKNISQVDDPQCKSGWFFGADNPDDAEGCPLTDPPYAATQCQTSVGPSSHNPCSTANPTTCPAGEICLPSANGKPKYGDYNGNACMNGQVYLAWASGTAPPGVTNPAGATFPTTISVYTDRLVLGSSGNYQEACLTSAPVVCNDGLFCNSSGVCDNCPEETAANATGTGCVSTQVTPVLGNLGCQNGKDPATGDCLPCPPGFHQEKKGAGCVGCPSNEVWSIAMQKCCNPKTDPNCNALPQ